MNLKMQSGVLFCKFNQIDTKYTLDLCVCKIGIIKLFSKRILKFLGFGAIILFLDK